MNVNQERSPWLYHLAKFCWLLAPVLYALYLLLVMKSGGRTEALFIFCFFWLGLTPFYWNHLNNMIWLMKCQNLHEPLGDQNELLPSATHPSPHAVPAPPTSPRAETSLSDIEKSQIAKDLVRRAQLAAQDTD